MDAAAYLARIGYHGSVEPSLEALREHQRHHLLSVPFESLSIHCGERITLDTPAVYNKIVERNRGGFCYENNSLFFWLLWELGYQATMLSAQVKNAFTKVYGPPFDHMILLVDLGGHRWVCDVGISTSFQTPLLLEASTEQVQENGQFRFCQDGDVWFLESLLESQAGGEAWSILYKFTLAERKLEDFRAMCEYHQTSPSSILFCKSFCSLHLPQGKLTYMGWRLSRTAYTRGAICEKETMELQEKEIHGVLQKMFGIVLTSKLVPKDDNIVPPPCSY